MEDDGHKLALHADCLSYRMSCAYDLGPLMQQEAPLANPFGHYSSKQHASKPSHGKHWAFGPAIKPRDGSPVLL